MNVIDARTAAALRRYGLEVKDGAPKLEHRCLNFEVKSVTDDGVFEGYASVFGVVDYYRDVVAKGAFKASLRDWRSRKMLPPILWQHDSSQPIGPWLDMQEDDVGLLARGQLLIQDVPKAREAHALLKAKAINGLSIGYVTRDDSYDEKENVRTIKKADLWEASVVTFPANVEATVTAVKSICAGGKLPTLSEFEDFLREAGFSKSQAAAVAGKGLRPLLRGEPGNQLADLLSAIKSKPLTR